MNHFLFSLACLVLLACTPEMPVQYVLDEKDLVPEGIAYSEAEDAFYLSSVTKSKIVRVDRRTGKQTDFIGERDFGYQPGVGIYIDDHRPLLHAIGGYARRPDSLSALYSFHLDSRELRRRYNAPPGVFLNDLTQDAQGNLYLTDSNGASIFLLRPGTDALELFYESPEIQFPNGIAISPDDTKLYIASFENGVRILDLQTKRLLNARDSLGISQGIDGLEFHEGHLYAVQNGSRANGFNFRKLVLNQTQDRIRRAEVIDSDNPDLQVPLTFCFAGHTAVVIGNSNLEYLNQETMRFSDTDTLPKTKLLVYTID